MHVARWNYDAGFRLVAIMAVEDDLHVAVGMLSCRSFFTLSITQGAELMASFGVNVPPGKPAFNLEDVKLAMDAMADENGEVLAVLTIVMIKLIDIGSIASP